MASSLVLYPAFPCGRAHPTSEALDPSLNPSGPLSCQSEEMRRPTAAKEQNCLFPKDSVLRRLTIHRWLPLEGDLYSQADIWLWNFTIRVE